MGDRLAEDYESLEVVMDPPSFGYGAGVTKLSIGDSSGWQKPMTAGSAAMLEPASGALIQAVEFVLPTAMNEDMEFLARVEGAGTAAQEADFTLPSGPVILKAGSTRLQVPVTVLADDSDEADETFELFVSGTLKSGFFSCSAKVTIMDSWVPGLKADEYTGGQGAILTVDARSGLAANDPSPPRGGYALAGSPGWGNVTVQADGSFTAIPGPNVIGPVSFTVRAETIPLHQYLDSGAVWKYLHPMDGRDPGFFNPAFRTGWKTLKFDDSAWLVASGALAYGGFPFPVAGEPVILPTPPVGKRYTDYFRTTFRSEQAVTGPLRLSLYCDDGAVIYINGIERGRAQSRNATNFPALADTYLMVVGGSQPDSMKVALQTVEMKDVPLLAGTNLLAISLHNNHGSSADLGLRLMSLETQQTSDPVPVTLHFADTRVPSAGVADIYDCPQNAEFYSSDLYGHGLLDNDGLLNRSGQPYDPVLEITASSASAGTLALLGDSGHFIYIPPPDFSGVASFTYRIRDKDGLSAPVPVTLNVKPLLPFDVWKAEALSAGAGGDEDSDGDGVSNFMEYALDTDPAYSDTGTGQGLVAEPGGKWWLLVRRAPDLAWQLQSADSPETTGWRTILEGRGLGYQTPQPPGIVIESNGNNSRILRITPDPAVRSRQFYRLKAFRIPPQGQ